MTAEREYPVWDGRPFAELPARAFTDGVKFVIALRKRDDLSDELQEDLVDLFRGGTFMSLRAAECSVHPDGFTKVQLWLPYFQDEFMFEPGDHVPVSPSRRWRDAEVAMALLARALPSDPVGFGFSFSYSEPVFVPWYEYCQRYQVPPEFVIAVWVPEFEDAE